MPAAPEKRPFPLGILRGSAAYALCEPDALAIAPTQRSPLADVDSPEPLLFSL